VKIVEFFVETINAHFGAAVRRPRFHTFLHDFINTRNLKCLGARVSELQRHVDFPEFFGHFAKIRRSDIRNAYNSILLEERAQDGNDVTAIPGVQQRLKQALVVWT
jgi:hypothetical protein